MITQQKKVQRLRSEAFYIVFATDKKGAFEEFSNLFRGIQKRKLTKKKILFCHLFEYKEEGATVFETSKNYYHALIGLEERSELFEPERIFGPLEDIGFQLVLIKKINRDKALAYSLFLGASVNATKQLFTGERGMSLASFFTNETAELSDIQKK